MNRRILEYATGEPIPEGAVYLCSLTNGEFKTGDRKGWKYVWHYYEVVE